MKDMRRPDGSQMAKNTSKNKLYNVTWKALRANGLERFGTPALTKCGLPPLGAVESWARKTPERRVRFSFGAWSYDLPAKAAADMLPTIVMAIAEELAINASNQR